MKLHALLFALLLLLLLLLVPGVAQARSTLVYKIPEGFTDVSPGAPKANYKDLRPDFVADATSGKFEVFAIGRRDKKAKEAFEPQFFARVAPGDAPITEILVAEYAEETLKAWGAEGNPAKLLKQEVVTLGGARAGRVLLEKTQDGAAQRVLIYLVPDGDLTATLTFVADASTFDKHLPAFEAAANATSGIVPATNATLRKSALDAILAAGQVSKVPAGASPFTFSLPAGMTDVTTPGFDPALAEAAARANFARYAIGGDGETWSAVVIDETLVLREADLDPMAQGLERSFSEAGKTATVTERALVDLGGVRVARLVFDLKSNGAALRGLVYAVPGASHYARLTYLSAASSFARLLPGFEAAASGTTGAVSPEPMMKARRQRIVFGIVGLFVLLPALALGISMALRSRKTHRDGVPSL